MGIIKNQSKQLPISKQVIFDKLTSLQIFEYYLNKTLTLPITIHSPFRKDERASFVIYGKNAQSVFYEDKATGEKGNCIDLVMNLFNITFYQSLCKINDDFNLGFYHKEKLITPTFSVIPLKKEIIETKNKIEIVIHKDVNNNPIFIKSGQLYWQRYGLTSTILQRHNVFSAERVFLNDKLFMIYTDVNPIFAYLYFYKNEYYYKIYRPLTEDKSQKFFNDFHGISKYLIHGLSLIPETGKNLIITKSTKDCMVLDRLGFHSIAVQSEGIHIPIQYINKLKTRWENLLILYDNDYNKEQNWGQNHVQRIIDIYPFIKNLRIPDEYQCTDVSELMYKYSGRTTLTIISNLIKQK